MGMDYFYSGSATYARFENEIQKVVKLFGGVSNVDLPVNATVFNYPFGYMQDYKINEDMFIFPENTDKEIIKWLNNPYEYLTPEETKVVWENIKNAESIIPEQIYNEIKCCVEDNNGWYIT